MGRLAGFKYREVASKLRTFEFVFDRQGSGSHDQCGVARLLSLTTRAQCLKELCAQSSAKQASMLRRS